MESLDSERVKSKVASARASLLRTGSGPSNEGRLSDLDLKFLQILGEDFGAGLPGVRVEPSFNFVSICMYGMCTVKRGE